MTNLEILTKLRRLHTLLVLGKRSNNLALALRKAIETIAAWNQPAETIVAHTPVKQIFAGYGPKFIKIFEELLQTGDIALIAQLQPEFDPFFCYLCEIPGIGETMARRMFFDRSIQSMDDLRIAYTNNVLQRIPAFGDARLKAIEDVLWQSQTHHHWDKPAEGENFADGNSENGENSSDFVLPKEIEAPGLTTSQLDLFGSRLAEETPKTVDTVPEQPLSPAQPFESEPEEQGRTAEEDEFTQDINTRTSVWDLPASQDAPQVPTDLDAYPPAFIESNSLLFRDVKPQTSSPESESSLSIQQAPELASDVSLSDEDEKLAKALVQAMEVKPPRDEQLERELSAVIARDLAEHGGQRGLPDMAASHPEGEEDACETLKGACLKASFIRAEIVYADTIHARVIHSSQIVLEPQHSCGLYNEDAISLDEIETHRVEANEILADSIDAREIHAHCISADVIVYGYCSAGALPQTPPKG